jgi:hypothetical protein
MLKWFVACVQSLNGGLSCKVDGVSLSTIINTLEIAQASMAWRSFSGII